MTVQIEIDFNRHFVSDEERVYSTEKKIFDSYYDAFWFLVRDCLSDPDIDVIGVHSEEEVIL